jgi:hypothetical protein
MNKNNTDDNDLYVAGSNPEGLLESTHMTDEQYQDAVNTNTSIAMSKRTGISGNGMTGVDIFAQLDASFMNDEDAKGRPAAASKPKISSSSSTALPSQSVSGAINVSHSYTFG